MAIRNVQETDYVGLLALFKRFFPVHNRFQQDDGAIVKYLKKQASENELIVYDDSGIKGALFLVKAGENKEGSHKIWKFRHFAFDNEQVASELLVEAEKRVKESSETSKIELTIAENEEGIDFYKDNGYEEEAALKNHYRWGETCFVFAKSFS